MHGSTSWLSCVLLIGWTSTSLAQVVAYDHHSTEYGDAVAAEAEYLIGQGMYFHRRAEAELAHARAMRELVRWAQDASELRYESVAKRTALVQAKAERRQLATVKKVEDFDLEVDCLLRAIRDGSVLPPRLLRTKPFASRIAAIHRRIRSGMSGNWQGPDTRAVHLMVEKLAEEVRALAQVVPHTERRDAIRFLNRLDAAAEEFARGRCELARN